MSLRIDPVSCSHVPVQPVLPDESNISSMDAIQATPAQVKPKVSNRDLLYADTIAPAGTPIEELQLHRTTDKQVSDSRKTALPFSADTIAPYVPPSVSININDPYVKEKESKQVAAKSNGGWGAWASSAFASAEKAIAKAASGIKNAVSNGIAAVKQGAAQVLPSVGKALKGGASALIEGIKNGAALIGEAASKVASKAASLVSPAAAAPAPDAAPAAASQADNAPAIRATTEEMAKILKRLQASLAATQKEGEPPINLDLIMVEIFKQCLRNCNSTAAKNALTVKLEHVEKQRLQGEQQKKLDEILKAAENSSWWESFRKVADGAGLIAAATQLGLSPGLGVMAAALLGGVATDNFCNDYLKQKASEILSKVFNSSDKQATETWLGRLKTAFRLVPAAISLFVNKASPIAGLISGAGNIVANIMQFINKNRTDDNKVFLLEHGEKTKQADTHYTESLNKQRDLNKKRASNVSLTKESIEDHNRTVRSIFSRNNRKG